LGVNPLWGNLKGTPKGPPQTPWPGPKKGVLSWPMLGNLVVVGPPLKKGVSLWGEMPKLGVPKKVPVPFRVFGVPNVLTKVNVQNVGPRLNLGNYEVLTQ